MAVIQILRFRIRVDSHADGPYERVQTVGVLGFWVTAQDEVAKVASPNTLRLWNDGSVLSYIDDVFDGFEI